MKQILKKTGEFLSGLLLVGIVLVVVLTVILLLRTRPWRDIVYSEDYFAYLGVGFGASVETLTDVFGEPVNITPSSPPSSPNHSLVEFEYLVFLVGNRNYKSVTPDSTFFAVRIYDPEIRFGRRGIGVGSTRRQVRRVYGWRRWWGEGDNWAEVGDGVVWLAFSFCEKNKVESITLSLGR
ncbi:MAG: hypothetical protein FWC70_07845 [Defluviitaleaceae bacterium]|nr:hypothetical protein [Defluviitaleaceae bacterium]